MTNYCIFSGKLIAEDEAWLLPSNRAFQYGDGLFETIYFDGVSAVFLEDHFERMIRGMQIFNLPIPDYFSLDYFSEQIERLSRRNRIFRPARIRLQVYREAEGFYTPQNDLSAFLLQIKVLDENIRQLNQKGLSVGIYPFNQKKSDLWSPFKSLNAQLYVQAGIWSKKADYQDSIILNTNGRLCETISSNIFIVKNEVIYTPPVSEACIDGVMRKNLIRRLNQNAIPVFEKEIEPKELDTADEIFTSNAIQGIRWIGAFQDQRYFSKMSQKIAAWI